MSSRPSAESVAPAGWTEPLTLRERALLILWPAFLMAGVLEMLVFVVVDPDNLAWFGIERLNWSRPTVYSVTFLIFWAVVATSGAITELLRPPAARR
jgi:hypothetical protein